MLDLLELNFGRFNGGQTAPVGSYLNPRTLAIVQQVADGVLPQDGTFCRVGPLGTETVRDDCDHRQCHAEHRIHSRELPCTGWRRCDSDARASQQRRVSGGA